MHGPFSLYLLAAPDIGNMRLDMHMSGRWPDSSCRIAGDNSNIHPLLADDYRMQLPRQQHSANAYYTDSFGDGQLEPQPTGIH